MKKIQKVSLVSMIGGSIFVADNVFRLDGNTANAITQETSDQLRAQRAAELTPVISFLLLGEDEIAVDDSYTAQLNTAFSVDAAAGVLANDNGLLNPALTLSQDVSNGSLTLNPDGSFEYLPNIDFTGTDSFTYSLTTSEGNSDDATVNIRVNGTPEAVDDNFNLVSNAAFQNNVIVNIVGGDDVIFDGAQVVEVVSQATALGGTVSLQANGDFQYTPPVDLGNRQDSFVYTLRDNDGETDTATIIWQIGVSFSGLDTAFTVLENQSLESQFTITNPNALQSIEVNGAPFTLAQLTAAGPGVNALTVTGAQFGDFSITGFNELTGLLNFIYNPTGISQDHTSATNDALTEMIAISVVDTGISTPFDTQLQIDVLDTAPSAVDDTRSISEGTSAIAGNTVGAAGSATGDNQDTLIDQNASPVTDVEFGATDGTVGTNLVGGFGNFVISSAGVYTYTLDNTSADVQGLKAGESLTDVFTYTITDGDGDTDSANVMITINGVEDALPAITITDENGPDVGQHDIDEGSGSPVTSSVRVTAPAGLTSIAVSGQDVLAEPVTITGSEGVLEVTRFNTRTGTFDYTYTVDGAANDNSDGVIIDQFSIIATDNEGDTNTGDVLTIIINDTQPSTTADTNNITEDAASNTVTGDLLLNDTSGADTPITVNNIDNGSSQQIAGSHGSLTIDASGTYSYVLSNDTAAVQALRDGESLTDVFSYTLTDADGSSNSSDLTVSILGKDEPPVITISDSNGPSIGDVSVAENSITTGSFLINSESGLATSGVALQLNGEQSDQLNLTLAQLQNLATSNESLVGIDGTIKLTGYSNTNDNTTIDYSFDPTGTNRDHGDGDESIIEVFSIVATDDLGRSASAGVLELLITDTVPTAAADINSVTEDGVPAVTGDVLTNDTTGADSATSVVGVDLNGLDQTPTVGSPFDSEYGSLDLNSDGTYTYILDNNNSAVQNLDLGQSLVETFSYTIEDTDGDTSSTNLTITINGADEPPSTTIPDANGAGAVGDVSVAENLTTTGSFVVSAGNGLAASGTALQITDEQSDTLSLTLAQLQNLSSANQVTSSEDGTLTLNGYANAADDHTITFSFDPTNANRDHSGGLDTVVDMFSIVATDQSGQSSVAEVLDILITDTPPTANNDGRSLSEGTSAIAGNALGGLGSGTGDVQDTLIDANATPVIDIDFGTTDGTVGTNLLGGFGGFIIDSAGVYTYSLDNTSTDVQGLKGGESITDVFTYTIRDGDGSTDSASITVTINGVEDPLPTITLADDNGGAAGQQSVIEGSGGSVSGTVTVTASAGVKTLTIGGQDVRNATAVPVTIAGSDGALEVSRYSAGTGTGVIEYTYIEDQTSDDHSAGPVTDQFIIAVSDNEDDTDTDTLIITIDDTDAIAVPDAGAVIEDAAINVITGNVFDNDTGADSKTITQFSFSGGPQSLGASITTTYGEFTLSSGGNFTYLLNNSDPDTNLLNTGDAVSEVFSYTLTDLGGDTSSSTLSITVNGADEV